MFTKSASSCVEGRQREESEKGNPACDQPESQRYNLARISFTSPTVADLPDDATLVERLFVKRGGWAKQSVGAAKGTDGVKGGTHCRPSCPSSSSR